MKISTSGVRGVVGEDFFPGLALNFGLAYGSFLGKGTVVVGGDTRPSHQAFKMAIISGLLSTGCCVIDLGYVPTPTVQKWVPHIKADAGMIITASHNPLEWNGIKFIDKDGAFLKEDVWKNIYKNFYESKQFNYVDWKTIGKITYSNEAILFHIETLFKSFNLSWFRNYKGRVAIDVNHGAGAVMAPIFLESLGVPYDILGEEPHGKFFRPSEPIKENLTSLLTKMKVGNYAIGFAQDADADRLMIIDEKGCCIGEDYTLAFCIDAALQMALSQSILTEMVVVVNVSTSRVVDDIAKKYGAKVIRTKVGETFVTQGMLEYGALIGGEGNGGIIYPKTGWGRDSFVGMILALNYLVESGKTVSQIVSSYPNYTMCKHKISLNEDEAILDKIWDIFLKKIQSAYLDLDIDYTDGIKVSMNDAWVHVRTSNTEPIVRIFSESISEKKAKLLINEMENMFLSAMLKRV